MPPTPDATQPDPTRPRHPRPTDGADLAQVLRTLAGSDAGTEAASGGAGGAGGAGITGVSLSSNRVHPGDLYAALPGTRVHGARFARDAVAAGAVAVLTDPVGAASLDGSLGVPVHVVEDPRAVLGAVAAYVYDHPAEHLATIAVTGTQGKTTTTRLAEQALSGAGEAAAVIGTVGTRVRGVDVTTVLTTPEAPDLQGLLARMVEDEVRFCAMEVSSHALVLGRVDGVVFDVAVFTNLGRDHLDFHADVEDYFAAKASLFTARRARRALVNLDDEHGRRLLGLAKQEGLEVRTFSIVPGADADWSVTDVRAQPEGSQFTVHGPGGVQARSAVPLPGAFNVSNALAALAACVEAGADLDAVAAGLASAVGVPGRLERVEAGQDFTVIVDYAHKPDALEAALTTLRPLTSSRVLLVIGAGGDRDPGKRELMGRVGAELADLVIVTDDNPRSEDPATIRAAVLAGTGEVPLARRADVVECGERRAAIRHALDAAQRGDIVVIAGKGHETGQETNGVVQPFDDRSVALEELDHRHPHAPEAP